MPQAVVAAENSTAEQSGSGDTKKISAEVEQSGSGDTKMISERAAGKRKAKKVPLGTPHEMKKLKGPAAYCCKHILHIFFSKLTKSFSYKSC